MSDDSTEKEEPSTKRRYDYEAEELTEDLAGSGRGLPEPGSNPPAKELYELVGERFRVKWVSHAMAEPIVCLDALDDASEEDVENALNTLKNDGLL